MADSLSMNQMTWEPLKRSGSRKGAANTAMASHAMICWSRGKRRATACGVMSVVRASARWPGRWTSHPTLGGRALAAGSRSTAGHEASE